MFMQRKQQNARMIAKKEDIFFENKQSLENISLENMEWAIHQKKRQLKDDFPSK